MTIDREDARKENKVAGGLTSEYFYQLTQPENPSLPTSTPRDSLIRLLGHYEKGFMASAAMFYRNQTDGMLKIGREGIFQKGDINHFQFATGGDQLTTWIAEMKFKEAKDIGVQIPSEVYFTKIMRDRLDDLKNLWSSDGSFLHPSIGEARNLTRLQEGIYSHLAIYCDDKGLIKSIDSLQQDPQSGANSKINLWINRDPSLPPAGSIIESRSLDLAKLMLDPLPVQRIELTGVISEESEE